MILPQFTLCCKNIWQVWPTLLNITTSLTKKGACVWMFCLFVVISLQNSSNWYEIWKQCTVFSCSWDFWQWRLNWVDNWICAEGKRGLDWHVNTSIGSEYKEKQYVTIHPIVLCDSTRRYWNIFLIQIFFGANYAAKSVFNLFVMVFVWSDPIWD